MFEESNIENTVHEVRSNDIVIPHKSELSYQIFLSTTFPNKIRTRIALQEPVPIQIPEYLNAWIYAAAKAYAIQTHSVCRYAVPEALLDLIASHKLLTSQRALENIVSGKSQWQPDKDLQQLNNLLANILQDWITIRDNETQKIFEFILKIRKSTLKRIINKDLYWSDLNSLGNYPPETSLACAAAFAWQWLISTNAINSQVTSAEITEGLLHAMIGDKEESEYFANYMNTLAGGRDLAGNWPERGGRRNRGSGHGKGMTSFAKATWLLCSMAKYLPRDDDLKDLEACFVAYPTILLG